jgi:predicted site-specific integrase-resolvase
VALLDAARYNTYVAQMPDLANRMNALEVYCQRHHTEIVVLIGENLSPEHEVVRNLMVIVTEFSARLPGLRSYRNVLKAAALQKE